MTRSFRIFVADIGGTNSRFATFVSQDGRELQLVDQIWMRTGDYGSFVDLLNAIRKTNGTFSIDNADISVFAVPGPVIDHTKASLANAPWDIDVTELQCEGTCLYLINDFEAQAYGCLATPEVSLTYIKNAEKKIERGLVVVGAGTGLGHCALKMESDRVITCPSEAGHIIFPFMGKEEYAFAEFLQGKFPGKLIDGDMVVSGNGLSLIHEYLTGVIMDPNAVAKNISEDSKTLQWFARFFARSCKNYALTFLPFCDVLFLAGGVSIKNPFLVCNDYFVQEFIMSGKRSEMDKIGIRLVRDESLGLLGSAGYALTKQEALAWGDGEIDRKSIIF